MAANEISLEGFDKEIQDVSKHIFDLDKQLIGFTGDMSKLQKNLNEIKLGRATEGLDKLLQKLRNKNAISEFVEGVSHGAERLTWFLDVMSRGVTNFTKVLSDNNGQNSVKMFNTMLDRIKGYTSGMKQAFAETNESAKQSMEVVTSEFQRLKSLKAPYAVSAEKIFNFDNAKKSMADAKAEVRRMAMELRQLLELYDKTGDNRLAKVIVDTRAQLKEAGADVVNMNKDIKVGQEAWLQYRSTIGDIRLYYDQIEQALLQINETVSVLKENEDSLPVEGKAILKTHEKMRDELSKLIAPYKELIEFDRERRANIEKTIGDIHAEQKAEQERLAIKREYNNLVSQIREKESSANTPLEKAVELDNKRIELMQQLIEKTKQASGSKSVKELRNLGENVKPLENELKIVQNELDAIYKKFPMVAQSMKQFSEPKMFNADGTPATLSKVQQEIVKIQNAYNMIVMNSGTVSNAMMNYVIELAKAHDEELQIKDLKNAEVKIQEAIKQQVLETARAYDKELRKQDEINAQEKIRLATIEKIKELQRSPERQQELSDKKLAAQAKLAAQGNLTAIQNYLKNAGYSTKSLSVAIDGLREKQRNLNRATAEGREEWLKTNAQIQFLEKQLGNSVTMTERLKTAIGKFGSTVSQIAMSFGVMTGVFGATNFFKSLYKITSEFQLQQKALVAIVSNAHEANILFERMKSLAVETPIKLLDLNRYAKQLSAYRVETQKLYDSLKMLGDISVGVGVDMDRLILAYGQVKAANYLRGQELRQFSEAGVNILGGLQEFYRETKNINLSINEIFDSVSKRKVLFEDVEAVLKRMTESGGTFYNMQLIQSQTLYGQLQKLGDMFQIEMSEIGNTTRPIMLGAVKLVQLLVSNLRVLLGISVTFLTSLKTARIVRNLIIAKDATGALKKQFAAAGFEVKKLEFGIGNLIKKIKVMASTSAGLKGIFAGLAVGVGVVAISSIVSAIRDSNQRLEELAERLTEVRKRAYEVQQIEKAFNKRPSSYKDRLAALQQLSDKAKEYGYNLRLAAEITPQNINDEWRKALEDFNNFNSQIAKFETVYDRKRLENNLKDLARITGKQALAYSEAERDFEFYEMNLEKLPAVAVREFSKMKEMREDFLKSEEEAARKYGITQKKFENEFAKSMYNIEKAISGTGLYNELAQERGISSWFRSSKSKFFEGGLFGVNDYESELRDVKKQLKKFAKDAGLTEELFQGMTPEQVKKQIEKTYPAWKASLKGIPEIVKAELPTIFAEAFKAPEKVVVEVDLEYDVNNTDINDKEWVKVYRNILRDREKDFEKYGFKYDETQGAYVIDAKVDLSMQGGLADPLQAKSLEGVFGTIGRALTTLNVGGQEDAEAFKKTLKDRLSDLDEYIEQYTKQVALIKALNATIGDNIEYKNYESAIESLKAEKEIIKQIYEDLYGTLKSKTNSHHQSMKSEYQSMIDFVRELNREFDTLRKNFNENDSARWAGATNRILSSFEAKFGAMPAKFKKAFQDTLSSIDFTTKEGTVQAENIVKGLIDSAKDLTKKEKEELQRAWGEAVGQIKLEAELELKAREDERLKAQVQKMFDDYNLTIELDKLGVDADEVGKLFNIDTKDLLTLEQKLESMKDEFVGKGMEKEYRQFMRKIVEINDKANLEMAKKYVKYLREEYGERAKVELEYMRQRAEVYALPFDENETMRILDNLQKETKKKLDEIDWKTFTGSDTYIELFEDLSKASVRSMDYMIDQLKVLKSSLSSLDPSNLKTIVDQIEKLEDELIKRDPFKVLSDSMKSWREFRKDEKTTSLINEILGTDGDIKASEFRKTLDKAIEEARKKVDDARENVNIMSAVFGAAKKRDSIISSGKLAEVEGLDWSKVYNIEELKNTLEVLQNLEKAATNAANSEERSEEERTESQKRRTVLNEEIKTISEYISSLEEIKKHGFFDEDLDMSLQDIQQAWEDANGDLDEFVKNLQKLKDGKKHFDKIGEAAIEAGKQLSEMASNMKNAYTSINEYLDSIGVATGAVGEAWKEFGSTMFDTIIQALQMIPAMVASIVSAETAINAAAGWIGLIAEAITIVMSLAKSLAGLHDAYKQEEIDKLQKSLDRLEKTAEDLSNAFDNLFNEDKMREFDAALIKTRELEIATLEAMIAAEKAKKKADQTVIDGYQEQIDSLYDDIQDGIDKFYESLGGFGSEANMKSMAESWTDAWYDAFKETGDGLSGLEDSFDEFIDNLYKKTILNKLSEKYFKDLYTQLDSILATEGGLTNNLDAFNDWIGLVQNAFDGFNEDATAAMNALSNMYGAGGGLEGLQASLQGMTEETADILAAYLNSVRFYVADNNQLLQNLYNVMAIDNEANPMLQQLKIIAAQTTAIHNVFDSVVSFGGDVSGNFVKVKISQ